MAARELPNGNVREPSIVKHRDKAKLVQWREWRGGWLAFLHIKDVQ